MLLNADVSYANITCKIRVAQFQSYAFDKIEKMRFILCCKKEYLNNNVKTKTMQFVRMFKQNAFGLCTAKRSATGVSVMGPRRWPL